MTSTDLMAAQLAELLTESDRHELEEAVRRWKFAAVSSGERELMDRMGEQLLALKSALEVAPQKPKRDDLELALRTMFVLADPGGLTQR